LNGRADLFSLGCVLYLLLTGERPFLGEDPLLTLNAVLNHQPTPPHLIVADVPAELSALVMKLLEKQKENRPGTAREVAEALAKTPTRRRHRQGVSYDADHARTGCPGSATLALVGKQRPPLLFSCSSWAVARSGWASATGWVSPFGQPPYGAATEQSHHDHTGDSSSSYRMGRVSLGQGPLRCVDARRPGGSSAKRLATRFTIRLWWRTRTKATHYNVAVGEFPNKIFPDPTAALNSARDGGLSNIKGKVLRESEITIGEYPGKDLTFEIPSLPGIQGRLRIYLVGRRLYQVMMLGPPARVTGKDSETFFDSFRLLPEK